MEKLVFRWNHADNKFEFPNLDSLNTEARYIITGIVDEITKKSGIVIPKKIWIMTFFLSALSFTGCLISMLLLKPDQNIILYILFFLFLCLFIFAVLTPIMYRKGELTGCFECNKYFYNNQERFNNLLRDHNLKVEINLEEKSKTYKTRRYSRGSVGNEVNEKGWITGYIVFLPTENPNNNYENEIKSTPVEIRSNSSNEKKNDLEVELTDN